MKSRTSFFNLTAFRKTLTRFAPVLALYTVLLLLVLFGLSGQSGSAIAEDILQLMQVTAWSSLIYAGVVAMFLFGDLYNTRLCNALHAFPMRREGWLLTNIAAGILFSLTPNLIVTLIITPVLGDYAYVAWLWLAIAELQYLFFFGTAVLSAVCAGNRLGMIAIYGIIQFIMVLVYALTELIYQPLIYGIELQTDQFYRFFPLSRMLGVEAEYVMTAPNRFANLLKDKGIVTEDWVHISLCAAVGAVCLVLSWLVYRRRHLERAGDLISLRPLAPVFLVIYTVAVGAIFYAFSLLFDSPSYLLLAAGLIVGFFSGQMLLNRTLRVFNKKSILGFAVLTAVVAGSMTVTWLDLFGVGKWVPELNKVESVAIYGTDKNYVYSESYQYNRFEITEPEEITKIQALHKQLADARPAEDTLVSSVRIRYTLKNGKEVNRLYQVNCGSPLGEQANTWFSDARYVFQVEDTDVLYDLFYAFNVDKYNYTTDEPFFLQSKDETELKGLLDAILADCAAGKMTQNWMFHNSAKEQYNLGFELSDNIQSEDDGQYRFRSLTIYSDCTNTIAYLDNLFAQLPDDNNFRIG